AGSRAASERQPRAALPGVEVDAILANRGDVDVDPLGESRVMFDTGALSVDVDGLLVGHEKDKVRVADVQGHRMLERSPGQGQFRRIHRIAEKTLARRKLGRGEADPDPGLKWLALDRTAASLQGFRP